MANFLLALIWLAVLVVIGFAVYYAPVIGKKAIASYRQHKIDQEILRQEQLRTEILEERLNEQLYSVNHVKVGRIRALEVDFKEPGRRRESAKD